MAAVLPYVIVSAFVPALGLAAKGAPNPDAEIDAKKNKDITEWFYITWAAVITALMVYTFLTKAHQYIRTIVSVSDDRQTYFRHRGPLWGFIRKQLIDSPLFRTRHHREFQINSVINMGTLPSRFQTIFLTLYFAFQIIFLLYGINFSAPRPAVVGKILGRSGVLATINMLPLFLLASRNNPFISLCQISFDTFNLIHRWMGRMCAFMAIIHFGCWAGNKVATTPNGWSVVGESIRESSFIQTGFIAFICFTVLLVSSPSPLRHAFYETFLHIHILAAAVSIYGLWVHLERFKIMGAVLRVVIGIWALERSLRLVRLVYYNIGSRGFTKAKISVLPGEAVLITCRLPRSWTFRPGQHAYLYLPAIGLWTSHPFSVSWATEQNEVLETGDYEKGLVQAVSPSSTIKSKELCFIVRQRTGFTDKLYRKAYEAKETSIELTAFLEGPYNSQCLRSFGTVILFAAGVGITHQVPHIRDLVAAHHNGCAATRRVLLVWTIRNMEQLQWVREWMTTILAMPQRREVLRMQLYVTRPLRQQEVKSSSTTVQMFPGRPNIEQIIQEEMEEAVGSVGVSCCGIGALADEVRNSCRQHMGERSVEFMEESFTW